MADTLPTTDSILGASPAAAPVNDNKPQGAPPTVDSVLNAPEKPPPPIQTAISAVHSALSAKSVIDATFTGIGKTYQEDIKDNKDFGDDSQFQAEYEKNHATFMGDVWQSFVKPAASRLADTVNSGLDILNRGAWGYGATQFGKVAGLSSTATRELSNLPQEAMEAFEGMPVGEFAGVPRLAKAQAEFAVGVPEDVYTGKTPPTPTQAAAAYHAASQLKEVAPAQQIADLEAKIKTNPQKTSVYQTQIDKIKAAIPAPETSVAAAEAPPSIHQVAAQIEPQAIAESRAAEARQQILRDSIQNLKNELPAQSPYATDLEQARQNAAAKASPKNLARFQDLAEKHEAWMDEQVKTNPQIQALREGIQSLDEVRRDNAEKVSSAYRQAAEQMPKQENPIIPEAPKEMPPAPSGRTVEQQHQAIAADIEKKAIAAGYASDQAKAAAQILARQYRYLSEVYGGSKGSAEEIYARESPKITNKTAKQKEMASGTKGAYAPANETARGIIRLFKNSDASTLIHEGAHHFMNMLKRFEALDGAPQALKDDMATIRQWLKVKDDGVFTTRMEEKFARGWEKYLMEGHAPSQQLIGVFKKFEKWLTDIYQTIKNIPHGELSDDVRQFFDRVLEPNAELRNNSRNGIIASEHEPGALLKAVHVEDAKNTPPEHADKVGDTAEGEVVKTAKLLTNAEAVNAIENAEKASGIPESSASNQATGSRPEPAAGGQGVTQQPEPIAAGGGNATGEGAGARTEPTKFRSPWEQSAKPESERTGQPESELVDKAGNIKVQNLTSDVDIQNALHEVAQNNKNFWEARRGVVTDQEVSDLADAMGVSAKDINIQRLRQMSVEDGIPLAVRIRAGRQMLIDSTNDVIELSGKAATGSDADALALEKAIAKQLMIQETISGITAEVGRGLRAFQDISKEKLTEANQITELLQRTTGRTPEDIRNLAKDINSLKDPKQAAKFLNQTRGVTALDKLFLYRNRALLSGPITHAMLAAAHAINAVFRPLVEIPLAASTGRVAEVLTGKTIPDRVYLAEAKAQIWAMSQGAEKGWKAAAASWNDRLPLKLPGQPIPKWFAGISETLPTTVVGKVFESPTRAITAMHSFFEALRFEQEYQGQIMRKGLSEGLEGQALSERVASLNENSPKDMMEAAAKETLHELFMDPLKRDDPLKGLMNFSQNSAVGKALFPMIKIEYLIKRMIFGEYTPLGLFSKETRANLAGANGDAAKFMTAAKLGAGSAFMGIGYGLASEGFVVGSGPSNPDDNHVWRLTHCPNSVQVGDVCVPLRALGKLGQLLELGATIHEAMLDAKLKPDDDRFLKHTADVVEHVAKYAGDGTFVQTSQDLIDAVRHPQEYGGKFLRDYATSYLPFSVGLQQTAQAFDRTKRDVRSEGLDNAYGFFDAIRAKIPFASYGLPEKFDVFGNPLRVGSNYDQYKDDPVVQKLTELQIGVKYPSPEILGVRLNNDQWYAYSQLSGQMIKESLDRVVSLPGLDNQPKMAQIAAIHKSITQAREAAKAVIKMQYPEIVQQALQNKQDLLNQ